MDIGRQALMRSDPGLDQVILQTLRRRYDAYLDTQLLAGSGTAPQHRGLENVTSPNTVTFTSATPTSAGFLSALYDGVQQIASDRKGDAMCDLIVMHPRRAAWSNQSLSSTVPLFAQGQLPQAVGVQDQGFVQSLGGIPILQDSNIATNYGAGTNQDHVYLIARSDFILMEGPIYVRVDEASQSGTGVIRLSLFAFSAFLSNRYPDSLCVVSGSGLTTPVFG